MRSKSRQCGRASVPASEGRSLRHTFAVCAYGKSPYLEACLKSLENQQGMQRAAGTPGAELCAEERQAPETSVAARHTARKPAAVKPVKPVESAQSCIILCTSTPSTFLEEIAARHGIPLYVREGKSSLRDDWNFAVACAREKTGAQLVTIAHQDDIYHREYAAALQAAARRYPDLSVFCTRYRTIDGAGQLIEGKAEAVKRLLRLPLRLKFLANRRFVKRLPLRFGNGIGCPTCSYRLERCGLPLFQTDAQFVIDWDTLWRLAGREGRFVCIERPLLDYRVHAGAATMANIRNHNREREELDLFRRIWPAPVARLLMHFYRSAYGAYPADNSRGTEAEKR